MINPISPLHLASAVAFGTFSAYFAYKRGKNPYKWFFIGFFFGLIGLFVAISILSSNRKKTRIQPTMIKPRPLILGPSDKFWYYLDSQHKQVGPISYNALSKCFETGFILPSTYVWNEEMDNWKILRDLIAESFPAQEKPNTLPEKQ